MLSFRDDKQTRLNCTWHHVTHHSSVGLVYDDVVFPPLMQENQGFYRIISSPDFWHVWQTCTITTSHILSVTASLSIQLISKIRRSACCNLCENTRLCVHTQNLSHARPTLQPLPVRQVEHKQVFLCRLWSATPLFNCPMKNNKDLASHLAGEELWTQITESVHLKIFWDLNVLAFLL